MKHPKFEVLQDYFENVLNTYHESLVKDHLLDCDECTHMLSHFAVIETKLKNQKVIEVSETTKNKIFTAAKKMLSAKKEKQELEVAMIQSRVDKREKLQKNFQEWKDSILPELKTPALQLCSLSIVLFVLVAVEKGQGSPEEMYEPLNSDVKVFTYKDLANKAEE
jgi:hypothetical protein